MGFWKVWVRLRRREGSVSRLTCLSGFKGRAHAYFGVLIVRVLLFRVLCQGSVKKSMPHPPDFEGSQARPPRKNIPQTFNFSTRRTLRQNPSLKPKPRNPKETCFPAWFTVGDSLSASRPALGQTIGQT